MAEPVDLTTFFSDTRSFLSDQSDNNTRDWFRQNKSRYDGLLKRPAERLLADIAHWLEADLAEMPRTKLFRPHRDVRFSEDKTPYHTHLHLLWSLPDGRCWFFGLSTQYATVGAGIMGFDHDQADRWRQKLDSAEGDALADLLAAHPWRVDEPELARVPAPWPADHRHEALLRHKGFVAWIDDLEDALAEDPEAAVQEAFEELRPLTDWMRDVA